MHSSSIAFVRYLPKYGTVPFISMGQFRTHPTAMDIESPPTGSSHAYDPLMRALSSVYSFTRAGPRQCDNTEYPYFIPRALHISSVFQHPLGPKLANLPGLFDIGHFPSKLAIDAIGLSFHIRDLLALSQDPTPIGMPHLARFNSRLGVVFETRVIKVY
ncbi:hypothetical protein BO70DRAFT_113701 [Aspergillus heteromorphus CBS 117.55]|uniref:Uncharacterized protein n=1 Tax=Aspergillus heteromorphus CBS 117.55 TaxID=1448321 RepID=A0A317VF19_9EURO|nr:uncharacterized protein BO70DRAFT_113701 [Aspergillus heteromorphus CBS 117.55]PWY72966.1 hypothetical protein BO70DRAFT_113701 [Aspergillus heteromorphus CBS 117.55]